MKIEAPKDYTLAHRVLVRILQASLSSDQDDPYVTILCGRLVMDGAISLSDEEIELCMRILSD